MENLEQATAVMLSTSAIAQHRLRRGVCAGKCWGSRCRL